MPRVVLMTWVRSQKRWTKKFRGVRYYVSTKQLGTAETRIASLQAANEWWRRKQAEVVTGDEAASLRAEVDAIKQLIGNEGYGILKRWIDRGGPEYFRLVREKIAMLKRFEAFTKEPGTGPHPVFSDIE